MKVACDKGSLCKLFSWKKKKFDLGLNYGSHSVRPLHPDPSVLGVSYFTTLIDGTIIILSSVSTLPSP